jgi:hypothetical protein
LVRGARAWGSTEAIELDDDAGESLDLDSASLATRAQWVVCSGWRFEAWAAVERHQMKVRELLRPASYPTSIANLRNAAMRQRYDVVVGLFVRRGDYARWASGRYYYDWDAYVGWTRQLCSLFPGRRVGVLLAGDERLPMERWQSLPVELAGGTLNRGGHWFESFLELSACDHIVSAPSTFAACAAFLGGTTIWPLRAAGQVLSPCQSLTGGLLGAHHDPDFSRAVH